MKWLLPLVLGSVCTSSAADFAETVLPILRSNCVPCHDQLTNTSGFSVATEKAVLAGGARHGSAVKPGNPEQSPLVQLLRGQLKPQMPFGKVLPESSIAAIENWIRGLKPDALAAAVTTKYWAFVPPVRPEPPPVGAADRVRNSIDSFVVQRLEEKGLQLSPEANRRVLIRRLYLDLLGLPPKPEEIKEFVENSSPNAYEELVDRLLQSPHYGERWGRHWLDLARYADTTGYEGDAEYSHAWRYRDYVIDAFNSDKPYDEFIIDQIAGDETEPVTSAGGLPAPKPEQVVALTFLRLAPFTEPRGEESRDVLLSEMVSTASSAFLGLTIGCAKCHDHKYDMIPTKDFYRMKAFFAAVYVAPALPGDIRQAGGPQPAEFYRPHEKERANEIRTAYEKELSSVEAAFAAFTDPLLNRLAELWKRDKPAETKPPTLRDLKAVMHADNNNQLGPEKKDQTFSTEEKQQYFAFEEKIGRLKNVITRWQPLAMSLRNADDPPYGPNVPATHVLIRGEYNNYGEIVEPGFPSAIVGNSDPAEIPLDRYKRHPTRNRRLTLARWIASPNNPLTGRVMVNRIWQHHFGRGIVETPSDFGRNGSSPTHPALLDWLATEFVERKWSVKAMHRLILTSAAYRQASGPVSTKAAEVDPDNLLLSRFPHLRLEGEVIRDSVLAASGRLNLALSGPAVFPPLPKGLDEEQKVQSVNTWATTEGPEGLRRSIYVYQRRSLSLPMLETFDAPVLNAPCDRRRTSVTALQPLAMYNSEFANTEAKHFAERVRRDVGPDRNEQVQRAFEIALGRLPSASEKKKMSYYLASLAPGEDGMAGVCRVLLNSNEFIYVD